MTLCTLGLGSNLRTPRRKLRQALILLRTLPRSRIVRVSSLYLTKPYGVSSQPPYFNRVVAVRTTLPPERLLHHCQEIEQKLGRLRKKHWGARTIDIDILLYGNRTIHTKTLTVPHRELCLRDFVLLPLLEICPNASLPNGETLSSHLLTCKRYVISNTFG